MSQGPFKTPEALARAIRARAVTPERIRKALRHAHHGTRAEWTRTLDALPAEARATAAAASASAVFRG